MTKLLIHEFTITRQSRWDDGKQIVEISQGGMDYANPDALVAEYDGEFETFNGMKNAVEKAIEIAEAWKKDTKEDIYIAVGCTHGFTMNFDERETTEEVYAELRQEAEEFDAKLPCCSQCGEILGEVKYGDTDMGEYDCCSEYCAEQRYFTPEECGNCGETYYDEGEEHHVEGFCSQHCLNCHCGDDQ